MPELPDYDVINPEPGDEPAESPAGGRPVGVWIAASLIVAAAGIAAYIAFGARTAPPAVETIEPQAVNDAPQPLGGEPTPVTVPPLGESDPVVRELVKALSSHPQIVSWLATDGLIRNFTTVVTNVAEGATPAQHLAPLRPASGFRIIEHGENLYIDPASYNRYNGVADAVATIDPAEAAKLYSTLKPRIQEAYGELGFPDASFDHALERAIIVLLKTPVPQEPTRVEPSGIGYGFADENLEGLSSAQKQLLRLGPRNMQIVQGALRDIAIALGIPAERLPRS
jgi:hypothetical protein